MKHCEIWEGTEKTKVVPASEVHEEDVLVLRRKDGTLRYYRVDKIRAKWRSLVFHLRNTCGYETPTKVAEALPTDKVRILDLAEVVHLFEHQGLGKAPFRALGVTEHYMVHPDGSTQATGTCDSCGQGIRYAVDVQSADGKHFKVGLDCAEKAGDRGMRKVALEAEQRFARAQRHASMERRAAPGLDLFRHPAVKAALARRPHPSAYHAGKGKTLLDYCEYVSSPSIGGDRGMLEVAQAAERVAREDGLLLGPPPITRRTRAKKA
jgi:hypothetical protein